MHSYRTEGIIIKRRNYGEADRIITVFTKHQGKIQIIAKGVRKISSRRSSHIELLNLSVLSYHVGKVFILSEAETLKHYGSLKSDLKKAGYAFYICELVDGLLPEHQENRMVFELLQRTLLELEREIDYRKIINNFEQEMLILLGFWPKEREFLMDTSEFIENIMEKKIKTKRMILQFS